MTITQLEQSSAENGTITVHKTKLCEGQRQANFGGISELDIFRTSEILKCFQNFLAFSLVFISVSLLYSVLLNYKLAFIESFNQREMISKAAL